MLRKRSERIKKEKIMEQKVVRGRGPRKRENIFAKEKNIYILYIRKILIFKNGNIYFFK